MANGYIPAEVERGCDPCRPTRVEQKAFLGGVLGIDVNGERQPISEAGIVDLTFIEEETREAAEQAIASAQAAAESEQTASEAAASARSSASAAQSAAAAAQTAQQAAEAAQSNAANSATAAQESATAAAGSATAANLSATAAAGSATQAGQSATAASGSATSASGSATQAANSATQASGSATSASASATAAQTAQTKAETAQTKAEAAQAAAEGAESRIMDTVPDAVADWLDDHVDPETGYVIDDSLTIQGAAADAKKTGDEIANLKTAITPLPDLVLEVDGGSKTLEIEDLQVGYYSSDVYNSSTNYRWGTVDCTEVAQAVVNLSAIADSANIQTLNANKGYVRSIGNWQTGTKTINLASNEKYLRISARTNDVSKIVVTGTVRNYIAKSVETLEENMISFKNLVGLSAGVFYPAEIKKGDSVVLSTIDGANLGQSVHVEFYDVNYNYVTEVHFQANSAGRVVEYTQDTATRFLKLSAPPPKAIQVEINTASTEYEEYSVPIKNPSVYDSLVSIDKNTFISDYNTYDTVSDMQKINTKILETSGNAEQFLFFTDAHLAVQTGNTFAFESKLVPWINRLESVYNESAMSFCLCGGDWIGNSDSKLNAFSKLSYIDGFMRKKFKNYLPVVGNHDTNAQGVARLTNAEIMNSTQRFRENQRNYYKYEAPTSTVYVFATGNENEALSTYQYEQLAWFGNSLLSDNSEHIIIAAHILFYSGSNVEPLTNKILEIAQAYNARSTITVNNVEYDFTSNTGTVSFFVGGHKHTDETGTLKGIPYILTTAFGTSTIWRYDAMIADWNAKKLYAVRIGSGEDRTIDIL